MCSRISVASALCSWRSTKTSSDSFGREEKTVKKRDPELEALLERGRVARRQMQEIIERVDTKLQERQARSERGFFRRLFAR
jgi:hypothetical protein